MKGTEKQVKWAEDIKANLLRTYEAVIPMMPAADAEMMGNVIEMLNAVESAGDIITAYGDVKFNGDLQHDFGRISFANNYMAQTEPKLLAKFMPV